MKSLIHNTTIDDFLGGRISLYQPREGYRANIDSVLLASAVNAEAGQHVLELGCGVGTVIYCLKARIPDVEVVGVEIQKRYAQLAALNAKRNNFRAKIVPVCITKIPSEYKKSPFHFVILNPPYRKSSNSVPPRNIERDISTRESELKLADWIKVAISRCAFNGQVVLIHDAERLQDVLKAFASTMGNVCILPLSSHKKQNAKRILIRATKGSRGALSILPPLVIHKNESDIASGENYSLKVKKILSQGTILTW